MKIISTVKISLLSICASMTFQTSHAGIYNHYSSLYKNNDSLHTNKGGSYLFCVNPKKNFATKWAKPSDKNWNVNGSLSYPNKNIFNQGGIWIPGSEKSNNHSQYYLIAQKEFANKEKADEFCQALIKKCQSDVKNFNQIHSIIDDSHEYTQIGASSYAIPTSEWGIILTKYENSSSEIVNQSCSNWRHKKGEKIEFPSRPIAELMAETSLLYSTLPFYY
ncbi:hypothetical protein [Silvanigrella aquatica]|uniref:Uncharacterized protein n=1 Tax=Silvanigrella aquatica TaxID=1915309 RepID=A0A1L4D427_9BACT|nr:hypothetical protein [Silvanigrella aquatica]APJ04939.1 hypothetical protein AXG55_13955 [Silvanigrella aquatica]